MNNLAVTHNPRITCNLTPEEWAMYDIAGARKAADELNRMVERAINDAADRADAIRRIDVALDLYRNFGVDDTEGRVVASQIIRAAYPTQD